MPTERTAVKGDPAPVGRRDTRFKKGQRPHNAAPAAADDTLEGLVKRVTGERRKVLKNGDTVEMSLAEQLLRAEVQAAVNGDAKAIRMIIRMMIKHPKVAEISRTEFRMFINGALALL